MEHAAYDELVDEYDFEDVEDDELYLAELGEVYTAQATALHHLSQRASTVFDDLEDFEGDTGSVGILDKSRADGAYITIIRIFVSISSRAYS